MASVTLSDLCKSFGAIEVLRNVSLDIDDGEFVSLIGPSGCGKSTLLRIIAGLEVQNSGHVTIGEHVVDGVRASERNLSMVFQSYALYPHLTVAENIAVPLNMRRLTALQRLPLIGPFLPGSRGRLIEIETAVRDAAEMLDIAHLMNRKPGQLSGGQRQRVAVGRALVRHPEAFLLDEPLSNLDAKLRVHMRTEIAQLHRRLGATFIYVTHDQAEAMTMSDRIAVMMDGELLQVASPDEIYNHPADIHVAEFIGSPKINILPAERDGDGAIAVLGHPTSLAADSAAEVAAVGIRPEGGVITIREAPISGEVCHMENLGPELFVQVMVAGVDDPVIVKAKPSLARQVRIGDRVFVDFDHERTLVFDRSGKAVPVAERAVPREAANG